MTYSVKEWTDVNSEKKMLIYFDMIWMTDSHPRDFSLKVLHGVEEDVGINIMMSTNSWNSGMTHILPKDKFSKNDSYHLIVSMK